MPAVVGIEIENCNTKYLGVIPAQIIRIKYRGKAAKGARVVCPECKKERIVWKRTLVNRLKSLTCKKCIGPEKVAHMNRVRVLKTGSEAYNWKGGTLNQGYICYHLHSKHPFRFMCDKHGRIREHRLIMAQHLGRSLKPWEIVHHKNGKRDDNRIENLELVNNQTTHHAITLMQNYIENLEKRNAELEEELCRLRLKK